MHDSQNPQINFIAFRICELAVLRQFRCSMRRWQTSRDWQGGVFIWPPHKQVPIRRMDAPRPAPANVEAGKKVQRAAPKRRRQAVAGGSTVLAALFCLFIYCGIGIPRVGVPTRELKYPILAQPKSLQIETGQVLGDLTSGGRALQAAEFDGEPKITHAM